MGRLHGGFTRQKQGKLARRGGAPPVPRAPARAGSRIPRRPQRRFGAALRRGKPGSGPSSPIIFSRASLPGGCRTPHQPLLSYRSSGGYRYPGRGRARPGFMDSCGMAPACISSIPASASSTSSAPWTRVAPSRISPLVPRAAGVERVARHRQHLAALLAGKARGDQRARAQGRLDHHHGQREARHDPVAEREVARDRLEPPRLLGERAAAGEDVGRRAPRSRAGR